jgi:hypothetical protein
MPPIRGWGVFPFDLEERILGLLSLTDSARVSTVCRRFQAAFTAQLTKEQAVRQQLALKHFKRQRIVGVVTLIQSFLKGEAFNPALVDSKPRDRWSFPEHIQGKVPYQMASHHACDLGEVRVDIYLRGTSPTYLCFSWGDRAIGRHPYTSWGYLSVYPDTNVSVYLKVYNEEDVQGVALVQALLSGAYGPTFEGAAAGPIEITVEACFPWDRPSESGVQNHIAPLLPWASRFSFLDFEVKRHMGGFREYARSRQGVIGSKPGVTLRTSLSHRLVGLLALPESVLARILGGLSVRELARMAPTCTAFKAALSWKQRCLLGYRDFM